MTAVVTAVRSHARRAKRLRFTLTIHGMRNHLVGVVGLTLAVANAGGAQPPQLDLILDRLGAYVLDYETKVFEVVADEQYDQWIKRRRGYGGDTVAKQKLKGTFFLVRLPDGQAWYGFRDVASVNGQAVTRSRSMATLLSERTPDAYEEALAITRENAKYNIGAVYRTINVPLQALELLHPQHRTRFQFREAGRARVAGEHAVIVEFNERVRPTLVSDGFAGDLPAHGRVWVDPVTGAVLRTDLRFGGTAAAFLKESLIRVDYRRDPRLQVLLPAEMEETYGLEIEVVHGRATYRNYRRFQTTARLVADPR